MYNLYADDTIMYCCSTPVTQAFEFLQAAFYVTQSRLNDLQLVLNTDKMKLMVFSHTKVLLQNITNIVISKGQPIKCVLNYRYLGFNSMRKFILKHILIIYSLNFGRSFSLRVRQKLMTATCPLLTMGVCFI